MDAEKIRVGVIGCGGMGAHHVRTLADHPAFELVAGCDIHLEALAHLPPGVAHYQDAEAMFERHRLDLVSLILPNHLYEPMVKLACVYGADVFTEKPFGHSLASCRAMIGALKAAGRRAWVGGQRKYASHIRTARDILCSMHVEFIHGLFTYFWAPAFADPGWRGDRAKSGGVAVIDSGWHVLDLLSWLVGDPDTAFCQLSHLRAHPDMDDKAAIQLHYRWGAVASLVISYTLPKSQLELTFASGGESLHLNYDGLALFDGPKEALRVPAEKDEPLFRLMYDELVKARGGDRSALVTDMYRAERIMAVVDACYDSARTLRKRRVAPVRHPRSGA
ncbi:MAG TPA: Gfo/Idh/MocA family oxidoreductase [Planctomycetota bacterium]|nr:Gfo/Idh/MocA family oxidoreductase [Planctomycetota bacterium]